MNDGILTSGYAPLPMPRPLLGRPSPVEMIDPYGYDPDATRYIRAVETADGARLEIGVRVAINAFVVGCKGDGIWNAIKASCIMAGARTLAGALTPLVGAAPTNFNFVSGDYSRKSGLVGNGSTKYLDTNRNNNADPQDSKHLAAFTTTIGTAGTPFLATAAGIGRSFLITSNATINRNSFSNTTAPVAPTFIGASRINSNQFIFRVNSTSSLFSSVPSETPMNASVLAFNRPGANFSNHRIAFYSLGESLNLALLDARVAALINSLGAVI